MASSGVLLHSAIIHTLAFFLSFLWLFSFSHANGRVCWLAYLPPTFSLRLALHGEIPVLLYLRYVSLVLWFVTTEVFSP